MNFIFGKARNRVAEFSRQNYFAKSLKSRGEIYYRKELDFLVAEIFHRNIVAG